MVDRSIRDGRHSARSNGTKQVASMFGTPAAETILASGHVRPHPTGRTYGCKRTDPKNAARNLAGRGPSTYGSPRPDGLAMTRKEGSSRAKSDLEPLEHRASRHFAPPRPAKEERLTSRSFDFAQEDVWVGGWDDGLAGRSCSLLPRKRFARKEAADQWFEGLQRQGVVVRIEAVLVVERTEFPGALVAGMVAVALPLMTVAAQVVEVVVALE